MTDKHTPTPKLEAHRGQDYMVLMLPGETTEDAIICVRYPDDEMCRTLEQIQRACNAYDSLKARDALFDEMVAELKNAAHILGWDETDRESKVNGPVPDRVRALLAKIGEK